MADTSIGEAIRKKRIELKLTQEELADDICSVGYLSKIENGMREPSNRIVRMLLERLGATQELGFKSGNQVEDFRHNVIRMEIMRAIENHNVYEVEEKLWIMKQLMDSEDVADLQFYEMANLIWLVMCGVKIDDYEMRCYKIWLMSRREEDFTNGVCASNLNKTEMWILSNIATGFAWKNHFELASKIYLHIYCSIQNNEDLNRTMNKAKAIMCNNIAVCMVHMKHYQNGVNFCNMGMKNIRFDGGFMIMLHLMRVQMEIHKTEKDGNKSQELKYIIRKVYEICEKETGGCVNYVDGPGKTIEDRLWEGQLIMSL